MAEGVADGGKAPTDGGDGADSLATNADGSSDTHMIDGLVRESWLGGDDAYGCYG